MTTTKQILDLNPKPLTLYQVERDRDDDETDSGGQLWQLEDGKDDQIVEADEWTYSNTTEEKEYSSSSVLPVLKPSTQNPKP